MEYDNSNLTGLGENISSEIFESMGELFEVKEVEETKVNITDIDKALEDYKESYKNKLAEGPSIDHTIAGECSGCAKCCQAILPMSDKEIQRIKSYIGKHKIQPINRHTYADNVFINICPFLSRDKHCMIYPVRPEICSRFICSQYKSKDSKYFNHFDKHIVNLYSEFLKGQSFPCPETNVLKLNANYTAQKSKLSSVYFKKKKKRVK